MENEIWKKIEGFDKYELSNMGRIKNIELNNIFTGSFRNNNQKVVLIDNNGKQKEKSIAYLIAEKFIDNPNNYKFIDHIDSDKTNNKYNNNFPSNSLELFSENPFSIFSLSNLLIISFIELYLISSKLLFSVFLY